MAEETKKEGTTPPVLSTKENVGNDPWRVLSNAKGTETSTMAVEGAVILRVSSQKGEALVLIPDHVVQDDKLVLDPNSFRAKNAVE